MQVPELKADKEMELLNKNFNSMIDKLKNQQEKLLSNERHEAWETVARKMAHEIKNPLTPIQLTIDNLNSKYFAISLPITSSFKELSFKAAITAACSITNLLSTLLVSCSTNT